MMQNGRISGHHSSSPTLVGKAFRSGFYWPTALNDATELVRACEACQGAHEAGCGPPLMDSFASIFY